jgi:hypothetical protein
MFNSVEMAIVSQLIHSTNTTYELVRECEGRGFISGAIKESLIVAKFLSRTVLAAQAAQRLYGVPASVLISMALYESGWDADGLLKNREGAVEWPGCTCCYSPEIHEWFLAKAKLLAESSPYSSALQLVGDVKAYLLKVYSLGLGSELDAGDILSPIETYELKECDFAGWLDPGQYRTKYDSLYRSEKSSVSERDAMLKTLKLN